jgi:hypothetical protein
MITPKPNRSGRSSGKVRKEVCKEFAKMLGKNTKLGVFGLKTSGYGLFVTTFARLPV